MMAPVDISPDGDGGILKEIKSRGPIEDCRPWKGDKVSVHYVGTLEDGTPFDSSRERGAKFEFTLGKGEVIKGWDVGVATMAKGELAVFTIKSDYAYGDTGSPPKIPGGATLVFEVELFDFHGEDITKNSDKGVIKRIMHPGEGLDFPNDDSLVDVALEGEYQGKVFDERALKFTLGEGQDVAIPKGVELAMEKMKKKEVCSVNLSAPYAFGSQGWPEKGVPAGAEPISYKITMSGFERAKESWQLDGEQKLEHAKTFKEKGTQYFKLGKLEMASKKYKKIIDFLEHEISLKGDQESERKMILQAGRLNLVMCHLKAEEWIEARNICDKVIEENGDCEKAYFRRGEALMKLNDHSLAKGNFLTCLKLDPNNKAAKNKVTLCTMEIKKQKDKEKKTFANMFDKFAQIDAKKEENEKRRQKPLEINEWSQGHQQQPAKSGKDDDDGGMSSIKVSGDVNMDIDLNKEIMKEEEDEENVDN